MRKLQMISMIVLLISIAGFILWRFAVPFSDWLIRTVGILMLASVFTVVFSSVKISAAGK